MRTFLSLIPPSPQHTHIVQKVMVIGYRVGFTWFTYFFSLWKMWNCVQKHGDNKQKRLW